MKEQAGGDLGRRCILFKGRFGRGEAGKFLEGHLKVPQAHVCRILGKRKG